MRIRFPSSATERREDERGHWRPVGALGSRTLRRILGRDGSRSRGLALLMLRVYQCGPIACGIGAMPVLNWESGCVSTAGSGIDYVISVVGWGKDAGQGQYWIVRKWARQRILPVVSKAWRSTCWLTTARCFAGDSVQSCEWSWPAVG